VVFLGSEGDRGQLRVGPRRPLRVVDGLERSGTVGQQPQEVGQVAGDHAAIALGTQEHHRLLGDRRVGASQPYDGVAAGAVLAEHEEVLGVQQVRSGPERQPVGGVLVGPELLVRLEVDVVLAVVRELDPGDLGQRGRELVAHPRTLKGQRCPFGQRSGPERRHARGESGLR
jgi:hypothetical protein